MYLHSKVKSIAERGEELYARHMFGKEWIDATHLGYFIYVFMRICTVSVRTTLILCMLLENMSLSPFPLFTYRMLSRYFETTLHSLKGQCHEIFDFWFFFHASVSSKPLSLPLPLGPFRIFSKICGDIHSSRCTTSVVDTGGKWKNSSIIKVLIILFGHLWEVELTYRYIFAFKFTLRPQQPDIVPIICHGVIDTGGKFAAGVVDTSGKFATISQH
jgi:hypothetical protein